MKNGKSLIKSINEPKKSIKRLVIISQHYIESGNISKNSGENIDSIFILSEIISEF